MSQERRKRININFRQTAKSFRAARQTQIFSHLNRNLPYNLYRATKEKFLLNLQKISSFKKEKNLFNTKKTSNRSQF
ncbi:hypothetical protein A2Z22_04630 [Candidatus Woesebacteria bacterium RBG_16_34_12]|uniref:Uncharacterized protein n=1 Tax=Candidatus Woesebacteria bacterium RBG_16_34_12 TaxID=1802480 RepID=A0A1F7XBP1_9BACT|nr:MAG: hypothetical protein A2Z22_04630 [Candidatus Woesebacteria bacterium RBG_16_34_12]